MGLTAGKIPKAASADHIQDGYDAVTAVGTPGADTAIPTEKAVRDALNGKSASLHASNHTDGTDDIQDATASQKGLATAAQITKLDGIEVGADVTDAANVASAGAMMVTLADAKGDLFVASGNDAISRLPVGIDNQIPVADASQPTGIRWMDVLAEAWFSPGGDNNNNSRYAVKNIANGNNGFMTIKIPNGANTIISIKIFGYLNATNATADLDFNIRYAFIGEDRNTNSVSDTTSTYSFTANQLASIDLTALLSGVQAGHVVGIRLTNNSGNGFKLLGVQLIYKV